MDKKATLGIGAALIGAVALGVTVTAFSSAQQSTPDRNKVETSFSDQQEEDIRDLVHEYLMTNPEVIIEAVNEYSRQQRLNAELRANETAKEYLSALLDPKHGYVAGKNPKSAQIAVIELFDYHCGYCKRATPVVKELIKDQKDVKVVFRDFPILRDESDYAAEVALASREQGKFLDMHFAMMEASGVLTKERIKGIALKHGVNLKKLEASRQNPEIPEAIIETVGIARAMGVEGTPAFIVATLDGDYINVVQGFDPDRVEASIEEARASLN